MARLLSNIFGVHGQERPVQAALPGLAALFGLTAAGALAGWLLAGAVVGLALALLLPRELARARGEPPPDPDRKHDIIVARMMALLPVMAVALFGGLGLLEGDSSIVGVFGTVSGQLALSLAGLSAALGYAWSVRISRSGNRSTLRRLAPVLGLTFPAFMIVTLFPVVAALLAHMDGTVL